MKIIFLDFDGVMDTSYYDHVLSKEGKPGNDEYGAVFDPYCIQNLNFNEHQIPRLLVVNPFFGLDEETAERAIHILNAD